jgi:MFS family permease
MMLNITVGRSIPAGAWKTVLLLFFVGCLNYLDRTMITTMRSSVVSEIPMTNAQFGFLSSVFLWVYAVCSPFAGFLSDNYSKSKLIVISLASWSGITIFSSEVTTFEELLFMRILLGVSEAFYMPAAMALIMDYHRGPTRSLASGIHVAGILTGQSLSFMGGWMAEQFHWSTPFTCFGVVGILYAILLAVILRDTQAKQKKENAEKERISIREAFKSLFGSRSFLYLLCVWSLLYIVGWLVIGWMPTFYQEHFQLSQTRAGIYSTAYIYPAVIVGVIVGGYLTDLWGRTNKDAYLLVPVIGLCIAAPSLFVATNTDYLPLAIGTFMLYGITRIFSDANIMPILCKSANEKFMATGYGILNFSAGIIGGGGIVAAGILRDRQVDLADIFQVAAILLGCCIGLFLLIKRNNRSGPLQ